MGLEELGLRRKVNTPNLDSSECYRNWSNCLKDYKCPAILHAWSNDFAKTGAIHALYQSVQGNPQASEQEDLLKALLTDRGLLFPQTRERAYSKFRSMRLSLFAVPQYHRAAAEIAPANEDRTEQILEIGRTCYTKGRESFYDTHDENTPFITLEKALEGIKVLVAGRSGPFAITEISPQYEWGRYTSEIRKLSYAQNPIEVEQTMDEWTRHVVFVWGDGDEFISAEALRGILKFSVTELYGFLAYVLRDCLRKDAQYYEWSTAQYIPALNYRHLAALLEQIDRFKKEDLSQWRESFPVLREYLHPDLTPFNELDKKRVSEGFGDQSMDDCCMQLAKAFQMYIDQMEPAVHKDKADRTESPPFERLYDMAEWFLSFRSEEGPSSDGAHRCLFLSRPNLIFHLFRSPVHRYIDNSIDRHWNLLRTTEDACIRAPLPVTLQSLEADKALFHGIVDVCADGCCKNGIPFQKNAWYALWECISQSVQCLSFQSGDLFTMKNDFAHVLNLGDRGAPVLDQWIENKLTSSPPNYIAIWRSLINKWCNPSRAKTMQWEDAVKTFRSLFENVSVSSDEVFCFLDNLCNAISWRGIPCFPPAEELASIHPDIKPRARHGEAVGLRSGIRAMRKAPRNPKEEEQAAKEKEKVQMAFKRLWMEWLLLQCVCDQARRELMESVYLCLTEKTSAQA